VKGQTSGKGSAIEGVSAHGVAGKFSGPVPLYLVPRSTKGHPSAAAGVFVVDHSGNLWYCKGGSTWKQLA
jgi:hypothetical protein